MEGKYTNEIKLEVLTEIAKEAQERLDFLRSPARWEGIDFLASLTKVSGDMREIHRCSEIVGSSSIVAVEAGLVQSQEDFLANVLQADDFQSFCEFCERERNEDADRQAELDAETAFPGNIIIGNFGSSLVDLCGDAENPQ